MTIRVIRDDETVVIQFDYKAAFVNATERVNAIQSRARELINARREPVEERAHRGYERYRDHCDGLSVNGDVLPTWEQQKESIRNHWIAAFTE